VVDKAHVHSVMHHHSSVLRARFIVHGVDKLQALLVHVTTFCMFGWVTVTSIRSRRPKRHWWERHWIRILTSFTSRWYELAWR